MRETRNERRAREAREAAANLRAMEQQGGVFAAAPGLKPGVDVNQTDGAGHATAADPPPLDWRLTPMNVILQLGALALFGGAVWIIGSIFVDGFQAVFGR